MTSRTRDARPGASPAVRRALGLTVAALLTVFFSAHAPAAAQQKPQKLPSPEKIVGDYYKAVGGKKRLAAVRDATYELAVDGGPGGESRVRMLTKAPSSSRSELKNDGAEVVAASNGRTAWQRGAGGVVETLTGEAGNTAKLQAILGGARLLDYKQKGVLARTAGAERVGAEMAYVVEFSRKEGGRVRFWFGASSKLLLKSSDGLGGEYFYEDYRPVEGLLEAHRAVHRAEGRPAQTYRLLSARYNTGLSDALFEPPADAALDVPALLRELARNQTEVDQRVNDYTFTRKVVERKVNDRGEVTKETTRVYEVYPVVNYGWVMKLVSEDGAPLPPERAAKEERRVAEELVKAEREAPRNAQRREKRRAERAAERRQKGSPSEEDDTDGDDDVGISTFLKACEFVAPRRERLGGREVIVFDFRPRPGFKPSSRGESIVSKLAGTIWVDPADRQVMRLEGRLVESFKMGGGLFASVKPGSAFVFEQARMEDGVWLPRFSQVNFSAKVMLFAGVSLNETNEFGGYKLFSTRAGEATLDAPKKDH